MSYLEYWQWQQQQQVNMELSNKDIIFASLMGSNAVGTVQRMSLVQNELQKHVLLKIPFLPFVNTEIVTSSSKIDPQFSFNTAEAPTPEDQQYFPLSFSFSQYGAKWLFPYEPMINISSGNNIIKRNVAKQGDTLIGTIKERWNRKDFEITVTGFLMGSIQTGKVDDCFPKEQMRQLFEYLKYSKEFFINCEPLELMGINKVVVEDYIFPFTKGENVQAYELKLTSDHGYELLIEDKPLTNV